MARPRNFNRQNVDETSATENTENEMAEDTIQLQETGEEVFVEPDVESTEDVLLVEEDDLDGVPSGIIVENVDDAKNHLQDGVYSDDIYRKFVPHNSKRPVYILVAAKGSRVL